MQSLTAVVLGATGLIGGQLVQQLLTDPVFSKVRILVRRPVDFSHPELEVAIVDFNNADDFAAKLGKGDCIFCCVGTTQSKVKGDKTAYRKIDFDIPVSAAKMGISAGFTKYLLVSSVGANAISNNFYLKLKGEVEREIEALRFPAFYAFRPSMLLGKRKEFRLAELVAKGIMQALSFLFIGSLQKYKGIQAADVAKAMIAAAKSTKSGVHIYHYKEMMETIK